MNFLSVDLVIVYVLMLGKFCECMYEDTVEINWQKQLRSRSEIFSNSQLLSPNFLTL